MEEFDDYMGENVFRSNNISLFEESSASEAISLFTSCSEDISSEKKPIALEWSIAMFLAIVSARDGSFITF